MTVSANRWGSGARRRGVAPNERGRAIGVVATVGPLGAVCGPPLGGLGRDERLRPPKRDSLAQASLLGATVLAVMLAFTQASRGSAAWLMLLVPATALTIAWSRQAASRPIVSAPSDQLRPGGVGADCRGHGGTAVPDAFLYGAGAGAGSHDD
jgi:hypothetical protein